jgi:hypothetical protein
MCRVNTRASHCRPQNPACFSPVGISVSGQVGILEEACRRWIEVCRGPQADIPAQLTPGPRAASAIRYRSRRNSIRVLADIHLLVGRIVAEALVQRIGLDGVVDPVAEGRDRRRIVGLDRLSGGDADR